MILSLHKCTVEVQAAFLQKNLKYLKLKDMSNKLIFIFFL